MRLIDADILKESMSKRVAEKRDLNASFYEVINGQPTEEAEPTRHGRWEYDVKTAGFKCSECGKRIWGMTSEIASIKYCSNCGAKMDAEDINVPNKNEVTE